MVAVKTVDDYLEAFPPDARVALDSLRRAARTALPEAEETISYGIPVYRVDGTDVVYFAGWKKHASLYPVPKADATLEQELVPYRTGRGTLRFPLDEPLPMNLIEQVIELLVAQRRPAPATGA